jgi:hypothetical protein
VPDCEAQRPALHALSADHLVRCIRVGGTPVGPD